MGRFRIGFAKFLGLLLFLLLVASNAWWYVRYQSVNDKLDASNAKISALELKASSTPAASPSPTPAKGTVSGNVGFPAGTAPAQNVCAVSTSDATVKYCVDHPAGSSLGYQIALPAGTYTVYATLKEPQGDYKTTYKAYYNKFVTCGAQSTCAAGLHGQNEVVTVAPGGTVTGVDPTDWYALGITQ